MPKITTSLFGELAILPYVAEAPIVESLEFYTDVIESQKGNQQTFKLREKARQKFVYSIPLSAEKANEAFNTEYGSIRLDHAIPIWSDVQYVGNVAEGSLSINCVTEYYDFRDSSLALIFNGCGVFQVIEIDVVLPTYVNLLFETVLINNAWIVPVRVGFIKGNILKPTSGYNNKSKITYIVKDNPYLDVYQPDQYLGNDIYFDIPLLDGGSSESFLNQQQDINDFTLGIVEHNTNWEHPRYSLPLNFLLETPQDVKSFKQFLFRRSGKYRKFWTASFKNDMRLKNTGNVVSILLIESDSFIDYAIKRNYIAIESDGVFYPKFISSSSQLNETTVQINLSTPLNKSASSITRISYLGLYRFDNDNIDLNWIGNKVVQTNINALELEP